MDEWELHGAVTVMRTGQYRNDGLQKLAAEGPGKRGYQVTEQSGAIEELHRITLRRSLIANEKAWAEWCPKPKGFEMKEEAA